MQNSAFNLMAGNFELAVGDTLIPAELLGDMSPNYEEGEISAETQAGTVTTPNGKPETSEFTFTMFLPADNAASYLGIIWPEAYNKPTAEAQKSGNRAHRNHTTSTTYVRLQMTMTSSFLLA